MLILFAIVPGANGSNVFCICDGSLQADPVRIPGPLPAITAASVADSRGPRNTLFVFWGGAGARSARGASKLPRGEESF